jgi:hypothetical protein
MELLIPNLVRYPHTVIALLVLAERVSVFDKTRPPATPQKQALYICKNFSEND